MEKISKDAIAKAAVEMNSMDGQKAAALAGAMRAEQPAVLQYLLNVGNDAFNEEEKKWFLYLGISVWRLMADNAGGKLSPVEPEAFDKQASGALDLVRYLKGEQDEETGKTVLKIIDESPQPDLLKYVLYAISVAGGKDAGEGERTVRSSSAVMMFFFLKILVDCLAAAAPPCAPQQK